MTDMVERYCRDKAAIWARSAKEFSKEDEKDFASGLRERANRHVPPRLIQDGQVCRRAASGGGTMRARIKLGFREFGAVAATLTWGNWTALATIYAAYLIWLYTWYLAFPQ